MTRQNLPEDPELASFALQAQSKHIDKKLEMGWIGRVVGSSTEKAGNIALLIVLLCFGFMALVWHMSDQSMPKKEITASLFSIITLALGYYFGKKSD